MSIATAVNETPPTTYSAAATGAASGIGGTSGGGANAGGNNLSLNLGGLDVNYDIGPNTESFANQAYDYLDNSFSADTALLGSTIVGSEDYLSGYAQPVLSMAQSQQEFNTQTLPTMFQSLQNQNQSLGQAALQTESEVAQASIQSSAAEANQAASSGGGFCWISTAVCETLGLSDECAELAILRKFRDTYMQETAERRAMVAEYYDLMRRFDAQLRSDPHRSYIARQLYDCYVEPAVFAIKQNQYTEALRLYIGMVQRIKATYL